MKYSSCIFNTRGATLSLQANHLLNAWVCIWLLTKDILRLAFAETSDRRWYWPSDLLNPLGIDVSTPVCLDCFFKISMVGIKAATDRKWQRAQEFQSSDSNLLRLRIGQAYGMVVGEGRIHDASCTSQLGAIPQGIKTARVERDQVSHISFGSIATDLSKVKRRYSFLVDCRESGPRKRL